jgi:nitrous oxide reductase
MKTPADLSRRQFLQSSSAAAAAGTLAAGDLSAQNTPVANSSLLRIGLIGCG